MSRFKVSVVALGVIVLAIVTIGACAGQAGAAPHTTSAAPQRVSRAAVSSQLPRDRMLGSAADSEWAMAAHVNW